MKTMTFIIGLFMLPLMGTTAPLTPPVSNVSGFWESDCGTIRLFIEGDRRGLRVRNSQYGRWAFFDRARGTSNTYVNGRSKSLRVKSDRRILFEDRRNRTRLTLKKKGNRGNRGWLGNRNDLGNRYGYGNRSDNRDRYGNSRYGGRYNDNYRYRNQRGDRGLGNQSAKQIRKTIDNSWYNRQYDMKIKIKDTDSGIKMKRRFFDGYTHYLQDFRNPTIFSDARGNTIELVSRNEILWHDSYNGRTIYFERD